MMNQPSFMSGLQQGANDDANSIGRAIVEAIAELRTSLDAFAANFGVTQFTGSFTTTAAASMVIPNPNIVAGSIVLLAPTGTSSATQQAGAALLFVEPASHIAGSSFTVKTANAAAASAGLIFNYVIINPAT